MTDLKTVLQEAFDRFDACYYRHEKSGNVYKVLGVCIREADLQPQVRYCPADERCPVEFTRPVEEWFEQVALPIEGGFRVTPRFVAVEKVERWEPVRSPA